MTAQQKPYRIQLLYVPDCPLVESARSVLKKSLAETHVDAVVEELVGDYSSPTILIDGFDVTGRSREPESLASCRLDLPTHEQILVALRGFSAPNCKRAGGAEDPGVVDTGHASDIYSCRMQAGYERPVACEGKSFNLTDPASIGGPVKGQICEPVKICF
jgi:hypothetical protein